MKKVLITGADFKNKGGQSMLYITVSELRRRYPGCEIFFPTNTKVDPNYKLTPVYYCFDSLKYMHGGLDRVYATVKGLAKLCLRKNGNIKQIKMLGKVFPEFDAIVDISGFNLSSDWNEKINYKFLEYIRQAKKYNIPVYLMPQSFGPFDYKKKQAKMDCDIRELLSYCKVVCAREKEGYDLLVAKYGLTNVSLSPDLVLQNAGIKMSSLFVQPPQVTTPKLATVGNVAIIPNSKSFEHGNRDNLLSLYKRLITKTRSLGKTVYLFQHSGNDLRFCELIKAMYVDDEGVILIKNEFDCLQYSDFIRQFDFIIASRYHAIVHALKEGVPSVALGWAVKYTELLRKFGMEAYVFNVTKDYDPDNICNAVEALCEEHKQWSEKIRKNLQQIQAGNCFDLLGKAADDHGFRVDSTTVKQNLCNSCGVCAGICPKKSIRMIKNQNGQFVPEIDEKTCVRCGLCSELCQGRCIDFSEMAKITKTDWNNDLLVGKMISAYTGYAANPDVRASGVSGGCVTALVKHLLDEKQYDCAFMVDTYSYRDSVCAHRIVSSAEMKKTPLSRYVTVSHEATAEYITSNPTEKVIIVAVPCAVQGLLHVIDKKKLNRENYLFVGLVCDKTMTNRVFDYFEALAGEEIQELLFRTKEQSGWPGNVGIRTARGIQYLPAKQRTRVKEYFQPERCLYCLDKVNRYADIVLGDNYTGTCSKEGDNTILVNTAKGNRALENAPIEKVLVDTGVVLSSLKMKTREKNIDYIRHYERQTGLQLCPQVNSGSANKNLQDYKQRKDRIIKGNQFGENPQKFLRMLDEKETLKGKIMKRLRRTV